MGWVLFAWLLLVARAKGEGSEVPCGDAYGSYCPVGASCCFRPGGEEVLEYCCPAHLPRCCGNSFSRGRCCAAGASCVSDCISGSHSCLNGTSPAPSGPGTLQACNGVCCGASPGGPPPACCEQCCGGACAPRDVVCCKGSSLVPETSFCPASLPRCCPSVGSGDHHACCEEGSSCCAACGAGEACCGGCTCCPLDSGYCAEAGQCHPYHLMWLPPFMVLAWTVSVLWIGTFALVHVYHLWRRQAYSTFSERVVCATCHHLPHHDHECVQVQRNDGTCVTCRDTGCGREDCHRERACRTTYARQKMSTVTSEGGAESVTYKVVNATCKCKRCFCSKCQPWVICPCRSCQCPSCIEKARLWNRGWPYLVPAVNAFLLSVGSFVSSYFGRSYNTFFLVAAWVAAVGAFAGALLHWRQIRRASVPAEDSNMGMAAKGL